MDLFMYNFNTNLKGQTSLHDISTDRERNLVQMKVRRRPTRNKALYYLRCDGSPLLPNLCLNTISVFGL